MNQQDQEGRHEAAPASEALVADAGLTLSRANASTADYAPVSPPAPSTEPPTEPSEPSFESTLDSAAQPSVLIVADRAENVLALEALLEPLPIRTVRAMSAAEALARVDAERFALVLLDVEMLDTDGREAARRIKAREHGATLPILFVTAQDRERRRVTAAYEAGAVDYLIKPLDPDELRAKVSAFVALHQMHASDRDQRRRYADWRVAVSKERDRKAADSARAALQALEAADRTKTEFLSRMSHELRTPLNAILGYIQLLDLGILGAVTPEQHAYLNRVRQSAVHLLALVNEILDLVTLDRAKLQLVRQVGHLGEVCETALTLVRLDAALRHLTVVGLSTGEPGAAYLGDPDRVRQILVHLLTNAVKFTPPGGRVTLSCGTSTAAAPDPEAPTPGSWSYLRVADTGPGIAPDERTRIFEPFTQVDGGLTRAAAGTGLGLAVSQQLARAMGGDVTVRSTTQEGATFTLWLPTPAESVNVRAAVAEPAPVAARATEERAATGPGPSPTAGAASPASASLTASAYEQIAALGASLAGGIESIVQRHVTRLRAAQALPSVGRLPDAQLRDHLSTLVTEIAHVLRVMGQTEGQAPEMLRDGSEILRLISELHGAQRERLDWTEDDVTREVELLHAEIGQHLHGAASPVSMDVNAVDEAMRLVKRLLEQSRLASLRGYRAARRVRVS